MCASLRYMAEEPTQPLDPNDPSTPPNPPVPPEVPLDPATIELIHFTASMDPNEILSRNQRNQPPMANRQVRPS